MINEIKRLLLLTSNSHSSTSSTSPTSILPTSSRLPSSPSSLSNILSEIENADDVFVVIEEVEIQEVEIQETTNKQNNNPKKKNIDLNQALETKDKLDEVKKNLYSAMCYY